MKIPQDIPLPKKRTPVGEVEASQIDYELLYRQYRELRQPYISAITNILAVSIPVKITINKEDGSLVSEYSAEIQATINTFQGYLDDASNAFLNKHGIDVVGNEVQS